MRRLCCLMRAAIARRLPLRWLSIAIRVGFAARGRAAGRIALRSLGRIHRGQCVAVCRPVLTCTRPVCLVQRRCGTCAAVGHWRIGRVRICRFVVQTTPAALPILRCAVSTCCSACVTIILGAETAQRSRCAAVARSVLRAVAVLATIRRSVLIARIIGATVIVRCCCAWVRGSRRGAVGVSGRLLVRLATDWIVVIVVLIVRRHDRRLERLLRA